MDERFVGIIADELEIKNLENITRESTLNSMGADSLDTIEIVIKLEEEYQIEIPDDFEPKNLGELYDYVQTHRKDR